MVPSFSMNWWLLGCSSLGTWTVSSHFCLEIHTYVTNKDVKDECFTGEVLSENIASATLSRFFFTQYYNFHQIRGCQSKLSHNLCKQIIPLFFSLHLLDRVSCSTEGLMPSNLLCSLADFIFLILLLLPPKDYFHTSLLQRDFPFKEKHCTV